MTEKIKWGIMGCGSIANQYANDLVLSKHGQLVAVGSRSKAKAQTFAAQNGGVRAYGSYEEVAADPDVNIVYVATPHPFHMENTLLVIAHGKHVLCEKPIALNAKQTRRMIAAAQKKGVFLMEGMWTRFFPAMVQLRKRLAAGHIGKVIAVEADLGIHFKAGPEHRIFNPHLGGGALLDLGIYPVSLASMIFGAQPEKITSTVHKYKTGVDDHAVIVFTYTDGASAAVGTSSIVRMKNEARIYGTEGTIIVHEMFLHPNQLTLKMEGKPPRTFDFSYPGQGMQFEADHVHQCLRKGKSDSDIMPLTETLAIMQTMDKIRKPWKLKYPGE
ncbi:MAG: Gfo/Idh/MocA family oxidoreductase [Phycisphaerae bacterium]|nr:Gfo/Idh/MocA family oxidoreductase [Phycisphaerae bacterium]